MSETPFHQTNYRANTHEFEQEVIFHFAQLMGLDPEDAWGYVTSGGTEGNMYGLYLARELHPEGMLYFSEEAHYSILKIARILNMPHTTVKRQPDGEIDYDDLRGHADRPSGPAGHHSGHHRHHHARRRGRHPRDPTNH